MNENQIIALNDTNDFAIKEVLNTALSKMSGTEVLIGLGMVCVTIMGITHIVCTTGSGLSIGDGKVNITRLQNDAA